MLVSRAAERTLRRTPAVRHARPVPETQDNDHLTPTGSCLCGAVTYAVSGRLRPVINCHCERCRRFTGHHMAATSAATTDVTVDDRAGQLTWYPVPGAEYAFCRTCGGSLFWRADAWPELLSICAGTLTPPTGLRTEEAWWVSQASDYFDRPDLPERATE